MTPGEPPAQLDDPLADLVVDVPQVRGESSSSTAASQRYLWVPQAGLLGLCGSWRTTSPRRRRDACLVRRLGWPC
jgi:hypothetical protein